MQTPWAARTLWLRQVAALKEREGEAALEAGLAEIGIVESPMGQVFHHI